MNGARSASARAATASPASRLSGQEAARGRRPRSLSWPPPGSSPVSPGNGQDDGRLSRLRNRTLIRR
jgi:hypothetical protein